MNLSFAPVWSWPFVLLCCAAMFGVVALGYPRRVRHLNSGRRRLLLAIRIALVVMLTFLMLRPSVTLTSQSSGTAVIYVVQDSSPSMQTPDAPGSRTRAEAQQSFLEDTETHFSEFGESIEIRHRVFSESLGPVEQDQQQPTGTFTSLSNSLEELLRESDSGKTLAVIYSSDGRQAAFGEADRSPVPYARTFGRRHIPIYPVVHGTSDVASTGLDVSVSELDITRDVFVRNVVPVRIRVKANGASGRKVRLKVLLEEPSTESVTGPMKPMPLNSQGVTVHEVDCDADSTDQLVDLQFIPQIAGELKVAIEAEPLDDEVRLTNNRIETIIRVRKGGIRVVYFDQPRSEMKWIRGITVSSRVQLDTLEVRFGQLGTRHEFERSWFVPGEVDAFIIGDVPADVFGAERLQRIRRCCEQGAGLMMIGGVQNFGAGGYQDSPIASLLPVDMATTTEQLTDDVRIVPTEAGLRHSVMQIAPADDNDDRWRDLPPLAGATLLRLPEISLAEILAESENGTPLLVARDGRSRSMVFAGDTTWQWQVQREWGTTAFQRFWRQVIFWITKKDQDTDARVWVSAEPRDLGPGQPVDLTFGARDAEGAQVVDAEFKVTVTKPDGTTQPVSASRDGVLGVARFTETDLPGDYSVRVETTPEGESPQWAMTRFLVNARDPELDNPSADPEMMRELAHASGGTLYSPAELLEQLEQWAENGVPGHQLERARKLALWDNWYLLLTFVGLMTFEWAVRKRSGLV